MTTPTAPNEQATRAQYLATGTVGMALWPIEKAHSGTGTWEAAHIQLAAVRHGLIATDHASLFVGAPAAAFALHTAAANSSRYAGALRTLDATVSRLTLRRLVAAHDRIDRGEPPAIAEFDLLHGLTGLGAYHLQRTPAGLTTREVLAYLVRLTYPLPGTAGTMPGWWTHHGPSRNSTGAFPDGHGNLGMAHGITGPLALLSLAAMRGITVDGHAEAIGRICAWLDEHRQGSSTDAWWPQWVTPTNPHPGPGRPSWCYGTPGIARAQQLAGIALGDASRQRDAEDALLGCLADPAQLSKISEPGLCHGFAGVLHATQRVAQDAHRPDAFAPHLLRLHALLSAQQPAPAKGLLNGSTGVALAAHGLPASCWDACLALA